MIKRDDEGRNEVVSKMWEIASRVKFPTDSLTIRHVPQPKQIVANDKYEWSLYEREDDEVPVEKVILEVSLAERLVIDDEIATELDSVRRSELRSR